MKPSCSVTFAPYLAYGSCLGTAGPLSAFGPLGSLGPLGSDTWKPQYWISGFGDWSEFAANLTGLGGPLSADGPLGARGPLGSGYSTVLPAINDFSKQLQAGGVWTVLGPLGPLGAVGPLGPLGPIGAHGFKREQATGHYRSNGTRIERTIDVPWDATSTRTHELFEHYEQATAEKLTDNDCSFMVSGSTFGRAEFPFASTSSQFVTGASTRAVRVSATRLTALQCSSCRPTRSTISIWSCLSTARRSRRPSRRFTSTGSSCRLWYVPRAPRRRHR